MSTMLPPPPSERTARVLAFRVPAAALPRDPAAVPYTPPSERETVRPAAREAA